MKLNAGHLFHFLVTSCLFAGFWNIVFNQEPNNCEMTYMYELPEYKEISHNSSNYQLYLYGEGLYFKEIKKLKLKGIPVIFIPGHGGSYKQARSLASVLLRRAQSKMSSFHFNVFTVDFGEEWVGLYGGTLLEQTNFLQQSIETVLSLYNTSDHQPQSVVLVGHSMGGVIARGVFMNENFDVSSVSTVLTFASPHLFPVINVDFYMNRFYHEINEHWIKNENFLSNITVLSVSGGKNDLLVRHAASVFPRRSNNQLSTTMTAIPAVNLTTDHQAMVWCKQLVLQTARFLFSAVDQNEKQITKNANKRHNLMHVYFGERYLSVSNSLPVTSKLKLFSTYNRESVTDLIWAVHKKLPESGIYYVFSIDHYIHQTASIFAAKLISSYKKWILICKTDVLDCTNAVDISAHSFNGPNYHLIQLDLLELKKTGYTHVVLRVPPGVSDVKLQVNILPSTPVSNITVPSVFSNLWTFNHGYNYTIESDPVENRFFYRIRLDGYYYIFQVFSATLFDPSSCLRFETNSDHGQILDGTEKLQLKLDNSPSDQLLLNIYTDVSKPILNLRVAFIEIIDAVLRCFTTTLPVYIVAHVFMTYSCQLNEYFRSGACSDVYTAHSTGAKPYKVQPFISMLHWCCRHEWFAMLCGFVSLPMLDSVRLDSIHREWFAFCPFVFFMFAHEIFNLMIALQTFVNFLITSLLRLFPIKILNLFFMSSFNRVIFHSFILSILLFNYASAYVFLYIYVCTILNLCCRTVVTSSDRNRNCDHLDFTVSQMWLWLVLYSLPSLVFLEKFQRQPLVDSNPLYYNMIVASIMFVIRSIKQQETPKYRVLAWLHLPITVLLVALSMHSLYRVPHFVIVILMLDTMMT